MIKPTIDTNNESKFQTINQTFLDHNEGLKNNSNNVTMQTIMNMFCYNEGNNLIVNMGLIKYIGSLDIAIIIQYIEKNIIEMTKEGDNNVNIHVSLKNLSITQIDKNYQFIKETTDFFTTNYPTLLNHIYLHHCNTLFTYAHTLMSRVFSKDTMKRVVCYK